MASKKLIVVKSNKAIKELNGILGPVRHPIELNVTRIRKMIVNEKLNVYECNPLNPLNDQTKLTKDNYDKEIYTGVSKAKKTKTQKTSIKKASGKSLAQSKVNTKGGVTTLKVSASDF